MKAALPFLAWALAAPLTWGVESAIPAPVDAGRYTELSRKCPFAVAGPKAEPAAPQNSFAANWYVSGIGRLGDADFVTIKARDLSAQFSLYGQEPNPQNQVTLVSIEWVEEVGKSLVTIRKGAEIAKLEFNEAEVRGAGQPTAATQLANGKLPMPGRTPVPLVAGAKPIPVGGVNGGPQRFLKTVPPPTNQGAVAPNGTPLAGRSPYQAPNGISRPGMPGIRRPVLPANQPSR